MVNGASRGRVAWLDHAQNLDGFDDRPAAHHLRAKRPQDASLLTQKPDRPFVEVAMLQVSADILDWSHGTLFEKLKAFGAKKGCDAVVIVGRSDAHDLLQPSKPTAGYMGSCIQYVDATAANEGPLTELQASTARPR
jgi:hypothetical protein